jgi:superfamily II DNA or RNA helicase
MLFQQIIGRGLRIADGKDHCLILDHSSTHLRLGFVTEIDEKYETLCDGKPKDKAKANEKDEPLPKDCPKCHFLKPPKVSTCPACGFKPERQSDIEHTDGDLAELRAKKLNKSLTINEKSDFLAELRHYGMQKSYKPGWAANKYRERFGVWPNKIPEQPPKVPGLEVLGWITHLNIKSGFRRARA